MSVTNTAVEESVASPSLFSSSLFLGHLYSYPTVNAAVDYAIHIPTIQKITTRATPYVNTLKEKSKPLSDPVLKRATPVLSRADQIGDKILSRVDERFPQLKETKPEEAIDIAKRPYETVKSTAGAYSTAAQDRINVNLVEPLKKASEKAKAHYNTVYDNTGKSLVKIDPYIHPINDKIEVIIKNYFPEGSDIPESTGTDNELSRTLQLAQVALQRARPVLDQQASQLASLPNATRVHYLQVYDEKLTEYGKDKTVTGPVYASLATVKQLSSESVSLLSTQVVYLRNSLGSSKLVTNGSAVESKSLNGTSSFPSSALSASNPTTATTTTTVIPGDSIPEPADKEVDASA